LNRWVSEHGWYVIEVKSRPPGSEGFQMIKWRWVVERTFAWLGRCRIHSRDYERKTSSSEAQIQISMIGLMLRRLSGEKHKASFRYPRPQKNVAA
jgi:putative transposase